MASASSSEMGFRNLRKEMLPFTYLSMESCR